MLELRALSVLAVALAAGARAAPADEVAALVSSSAVRAGAAILRAASLGLPADIEHCRGRRTAATLDEQPTHGLLDEVNCHLKAVASDVSEHIVRAMGLGHPFATLRLAGEAPSLLAAVAHVASFHGTPGALVAHRRGLEDALVAAKAAVRPVRAAFANLMPRSVYQAAGGLDPGFGYLAY